jgi:hypothetical protein
MKATTQDAVSEPAWWLKPVIPATQKAAIRRITVKSQPSQIVHKTPSQKKKKKITKKGWWSGSSGRASSEQL